jgi:hypothetical protein
VKNFSVLKGCVVSVKLSSSNWCFSISPAKQRTSNQHIWDAIKA